MRLILAFIVALGYCCPSLLAQEYRFDQLDVDDGLSQNTVNAILRDSFGYVWIGTNDGLNRYNGYTCRIYRRDNGLRGNRVNALAPDGAGSVWVGTDKGLYHYDRHADRFRRGVLPGEANDFWVKNLARDDRGILWAATERGLLRAETGDTLLRKEEVPAAVITDVTVSAAGTVLVAGRKDTFLVRERGWKHWTKAGLGNGPGRKQRTAKTLLSDRAGGLWVGTQGDGLFFRPAGATDFRHFTAADGLANPIVKDLAQGPDGDVWVATDGGGIARFTTTGEFKGSLTYRYGNAESIGSNAVYSLYWDERDALWVGTFDAGLNFYAPYRKRFQRIGAGDERNPGLTHRSVLCFLEDRAGTVWIGTDGGGIDLLPAGATEPTPLRLPAGSRPLSSAVVTSLHEGENGDVWIGTYAGGLQRYVPGRGIVRTYRHDPARSASVVSNHVWGIADGPAGQLFIGTLEGLDLLNPATGTFRHLRTEGQVADYPERVTVLYTDRGGRTWVGGKGLRYYDPAADVLRRISPTDSVLSEYDVRGFYEDRRGNFWIATEGGGVFLFDRTRLRFQRFTREHGLPNNAVHTIFEDERDRLWLSTNGGLATADAADLLEIDSTGGTSTPFTVYTTEDGLQSNQFSYNAGLLTREGRLFFGGVNGLNYFDPAAIRTDPVPPPVVFTALRVLDKTVRPGQADGPLERPIGETDHLVLDYPQSQIFTLEFAALAFRNDAKTAYAYRLEGFRDDWSHIGPKRTVTFTNLNHGEYVLHVRAANRDGVWNERGARLGLTIRPPFWRSPWAYATYLLLFGLILMAFRGVLLTRERLRNRLRNQEVERTQMAELNQLKVNFFTNISHEFRTPLTLINAPVRTLLEKEALSPSARGYLKLVERNTNRLLRLVNQLLEFQKINDRTTVRLHEQDTDVVALLTEIMEAFVDAAERKKIELQLDNRVGEVVVTLDADKLEKVVFNLLSNACKYAKSAVTIRVAVTQDGGDSRLEISVIDDGPGIPEEERERIFERFYRAREGTTDHSGTGIGLSYVKKLVGVLKGVISVTSGAAGKGSSFVLVLPYRSTITVTSPTSPLPEASATANDAVAPAAALPIAQDRRVLLVVEDNADVREFIRLQFRADFTILEAEDGVQGLRLARQHIPDIIISDVMMPNLDGIAFCATLREERDTSHIPILLLTASTNAERRKKGLENGARDYIIKPFDPQELRLKVGNIVQGQRRMRHRFSQQFLAPAELVVDSPRDAFLRRAIAVVEERMEERSFGVDQFARELGVSRSVLYRKFSALTEMSVKEFINTLRLKRAAQLLRQPERPPIATVAYTVGFTNARYFSKRFKKFFSCSPTDYATRHAEEASPL